jgi:hypothetical protein
VNKSLALLTAIVVAMTLLIACSSAAATPDEMVIPLNKYVKFSNNLSVYLDHITIYNGSIYNTYSPDPANSVWPVLVFHYENQGKNKVACHVRMQITDNSSQVPAGWKYDKPDESLYQILNPGQNSSSVIMEFAMPAGRVLTNLTVIDYTNNKEFTNIPIVYPTPTPLPTSVPAPGIFEEGGEDLRNLMLIPILLGLVGLIGWFMARRRLF